MAKHAKVVMSSLKSFVSNWGEEHEVAWAWLWSNVEKMLGELLRFARPGFA